jgi:hypothetical protein
MPWSTSLVVDEPSGEQVIRRPQRTDAIGASLREAFGTGASLPEDMTSLVVKLDNIRAR